MRATQTTTYRSLQSFLDKTTDRLQTLQLAAATGKRLNRPSDDPTAISPVLSARTQIQTSNRYIETIETGLDRVDNMDGYLDSIENTLVRIREIVIASGNGALSQVDRETYAAEVAQLRDSLIDDANAQVDGKYLFSGYNEKTRPFNPVDLTLYGGSPDVIEFEISPSERVGINIPGNMLMLGDTDNDGLWPDAGAVNVFTVVEQIEADLMNPAQDATLNLDDIKTAGDQIRGYRSLKGNLGRRLETARDHMEKIKIDMEEFRSRYEDADILETITSLEQQQNSFQAALNVTGKVSQLSILDYLQ